MGSESQARLPASRIWRARRLEPYRRGTFKLVCGPLFVEKVRDIAGLCLNPPDRAVVLSVDDKAQIQALDRTQPLLPLRPGQAARPLFLRVQGSSREHPWAKEPSKGCLTPDRNAVRMQVGLW